MLTARGWWFFVLLVTLGCVAGVMVVRGTLTLWVCVLSLAIWFLVEWAAFLRRAWLVIPSLTVERVFSDDRGPVTALWSRRTYRVVVTVRCPAGRLPLVELDDRPPVGADVISTDEPFAGSIGPARPAELVMQVRAPRPGIVRFEGVRVRLGDAQGFFFVERFVRQAVERPVLPADANVDTSRRGDKRINLLPPPGMHRHRRPGAGSELLELREYRPGDPPRRIAWKISAKRDWLITREHESEVPLRCTLLIDHSAASRRGRSGESALARSVDIAAAVAQIAISHRDLVGLIAADEHSSEYRSPARTASHLVRLLDSLARLAPGQPVITTDEVQPLLARAHALASDCYPDLMHRSINRFPAWLAWWSPPPQYVFSASGRPRWSWARSIMQINSPTARRRRVWRKRVSALICSLYRLPYGTLGLLQEDDAALASWLQRFLADHRVPYDLPERDRQGNDPFAAGESLGQLARQLVYAVGRGRDNELFVLFGDFARRQEKLGDLLRAVRLARARHHQVIVVQPCEQSSDPGPRPTTDDPAVLRDYAQAAQAWRAWQATRRAFGRLGASVIATEAGDPVALIIHRLEQMRLLQGAARS